MNNKVLKITMIFLIVILSIFGIQSKVQAKDLTGRGNVIKAGWWGRYNYYRDKGADVWFGKASDDTFCIEHNGPLWLDSDSEPRILNMNVLYRVYINGLDSYIYEGNTDKLLAPHSGMQNAIFAWILNKENQDFAGQGEYSNKQLAIYGYIQNWLDANEIYGLPKDNSPLSYPEWIKEGEDYAKTLQMQSGGPVIEEKHTEPTVETAMVEDTEYIKVGPYEAAYTGNFDYIKVYDQNDKELSPLFAKYEGENLKVSQSPNDIISSETQFFILLPEDEEIERINKIDFGVYQDTNNIEAGVWILTNGTYQDLISTTAKPNPKRIPASITFPGIDLLGKLHLQKVNKDDHNVKLDKVTFVFKNRAGKYIKQEGDKITYVDREQATEFITDENGEIFIDKVIVGTYTAYEVGNEHYGYEVPPDGTPVKVIPKDETQLVENKQKWIKLSGYVWKDMIFGKDTQRNDLFQDNTYDKNDELMPGVTVRLKSKSTGEVLQEKVTDGNGAYLFEDVLIEELEDYYIEFEYDGLKYTNVIPHIDVNNGSKSAENKEKRKEFNEKFSTVEGKDASNNIGQTTGPNGEVAYDNLQYRKGEIGNEEEQYKSFFDYDNQYFPITANTNEPGYSIKSNFVPGVEEIENINLGVYLRDKPDVAIKKDVQNAMVSINGYNHTYNYASRYENQGEYENGFNVGVKFENNRGKAKYTRPIYKSDALYHNDEDTSKELQVRVTYRIRYRNESTTLGARVNKIVDYYDADYEKVQVATGLNENGEIIEESKLDFREITSPNSKYKAIEINTPSTILEPGKSSAPSSSEEEKQVEEDKLEGKYQGVKNQENEELKGEYQGSDVYVQFTMSRDKVKTLLDMNENDENDPEAPLENVVEITSYTSFDSEGNVYAGIDMDSAPGNATPDDLNTYEDDTDSAPAFILQYHDDGDGRTVNGTVFEDLAEAKDKMNDNTVHTGEERKGNGTFDENDSIAEKGIEGVEVYLVEVETEKQIDENGNEKEVIKTDSFGKPIAKTVNGNPVYAINYASSDEHEIQTISDGNGNYTLKGFIPGKYAVQFKWGGKIYTEYIENPDGTLTKNENKQRADDYKYYPEDYKSTIMTQEEYNRKYNDSPEWNWYKEYRDTIEKQANGEQLAEGEVADPRFSDAIDDETIREKIDNHYKHQVYGNSITEKGNTPMISTSAPMDVTIEFSDLSVTKEVFDNNGTQVEDVKLTFNMQHLDFGIIERPRQDLQLSKYINRIKLTLANNQVLVDATIDEDGNITGERNSLTYMKPNASSTVAPYGTAKLELDDEVMQGATLEVQYKYKVKNISEKDYSDTMYYITGENEFIWPVAKWNTAESRASSINSLVGARNAPIAGASTQHEGTDIQTTTGVDPVVAISGGVVEFAGNMGNWGNAVVINHGKVTDSSDSSEHTLYTLSAHLDSISVNVGDTVLQGQQIGIAGATGNTQGGHVHLEARIDGCPGTSNENGRVVGLMELYNSSYVNGTSNDNGKVATGDQKIFKDPVTLSADEIVDYLDGSWGYDAENEENIENGWSQQNDDWLGVDESGNTIIPKENCDGADYNKFSDEVAKREELRAKRVLTTTILKEDLKPEQSKEATLEVSKVLAAGGGDIEFNNETEIIHTYKKHGGRNTISIPGNYEPGKGFETTSSGDINRPADKDTGISATTTVTSPTGADTITYIIYTASVIIALVILGAGIVLIKKKVLTK